MPKGGARINSGPPPDPNALRRDRNQGVDKDGWLTLPSAGYDGPIPEWPLTERLGYGAEDDDTARLEFIVGREAVHWERIWRTPHAAAWMRLGWVSDVAMYVRWLAMAETGDIKAGTESRQWSDRLGLNPAAMLRNRWRIAPDRATEQRLKIVREPASSTARERLKVVGDGAGEA